MTQSHTAINIMS